eukprot:31477-Pelagococcus_subviridis.AAC.7
MDRSRRRRAGTVRWENGVSTGGGGSARARAGGANGASFESACVASRSIAKARARESGERGGEATEGGLGRGTTIIRADGGSASDLLRPRSIEPPRARTSFPPWPSYTPKNAVL